MRTKRRSSKAVQVPVVLVPPSSESLTAFTSEKQAILPNHEPLASNMSQPNGIHTEKTAQDLSLVPPGRVISTSMMRQAAIEPTLSPESPWSSAIGHASTGKSGRVIERLQQEIDRLNREKTLLRMRHEEAEKANETLTTSNQYLQDRNSNYESSHEANSRQLQRKERQVEDLKDELEKEKQRTRRAEDAARAASVSEDGWREQALQAKAVASQKESEYDAIVSCRNMDNERHQSGLNRIRTNLEGLIRQREDDQEKQKRLELIAEQQKQTIEQLEELTKKLTSNFKLYRTEIDSAIEQLRDTAGTNDDLVNSRVEEMKRVTGEMKWLMNVETVINGRVAPPRPGSNSTFDSDAADRLSRPTTKDGDADSRTTKDPPSPSKRRGLSFSKLKRQNSKKAKDNSARV